MKKGFVTQSEYEERSDAAISWAQSLLILSFWIKGRSWFLSLYFYPHLVQTNGMET